MFDVDNLISRIEKSNPLDYSSFNGYITPKDQTKETMQQFICSRIFSHRHILEFINVALMYLDNAGIGEYIDINEYRYPSQFFKMLEEYNVHPGIVRVADPRLSTLNDEHLFGGWNPLISTSTEITYPIFTDSNTLSKKEQINARITLLEKELSELQEQIKQMNNEK